MCAWMGVACTATIAQTGAASIAAPTSTSDTAPLQTAAFDVVSIRPSGNDSVTSFQITPDGFFAHGLSLRMTILLAYFSGYELFLPSSKLDIVGAPDWVKHDRYDIDAKVDEATAKDWKNLTNAQRMQQAKPMLQRLLTDRCKLVQHRGTTEIPIYALVVGKHGAKLKETRPGEAPPSGALPVFANNDGSMMVPYTRGDQKPTLTFFNTSMASFANHISNGAPRRIEDQTGFTGRYDFVLPKLEDISPTDPDPPTIWNIEELGLILKPAKATIKTLVIDHIERPSEN